MKWNIFSKNKEDEDLLIKYGDCGNFVNNNSGEL